MDNLQSKIANIFMSKLEQTSMPQPEQTEVDPQQQTFIKQNLLSVFRSKLTGNSTSLLGEPSPRVTQVTPQSTVTEQNKGVFGGYAMNYEKSYEKNDLAEKTLRAMAMTESGGKQVKGASGEFGALQFMPATWKAISKQVAGSVLPQTPENEYRIAKQKVQQLLDKGYGPREIALIWNTSLGGAEKPLVKKGVNAKGIKYDSAAHADKVMAYFNKL